MNTKGNVWAKISDDDYKDQDLVFLKHNLYCHSKIKSFAQEALNIFRTGNKRPSCCTNMYFP